VKYQKEVEGIEMVEGVEGFKVESLRLKFRTFILSVK
jgi:hypothetical protein